MEAILDPIQTIRTHRAIMALEEGDKFLAESLYHFGFERDYIPLSESFQFTKGVLSSFSDKSGRRVDYLIEIDPIQKDFVRIDYSLFSRTGRELFKMEKDTLAIPGQFQKGFETILNEVITPSINDGLI